MEAKQTVTDCPRCREWEGRVAHLEALVDRLTGRVEELTTRNQELVAALEEAHRAAKRQAAPFSKGKPKDRPKKPGRKKGNKHGQHGHLQPPQKEQISEVHQAQLPQACPQCGGQDLEHTRDTVQYQVEIPRQPIWRQFDIQLGHCRCCGKSLQGRHELQTSHAVGAAGVTLGAEAQAAAVYLNKKCGLSHGKVGWVFREVFGIPLSRGGVAQLVARVAEKCAPLYEQIRAAVRNSQRVRLDETGWRVGGWLNWLHALVGDRATCYVIAPSRKADVAAAVLGWDYDGTLLHDGWAAYDQFTQAQHGQCAQHVLRRGREMLETARGVAARFPQQVLDVFGEALRIRHRLNAAREAADSPRRVRCYHRMTDALAKLLRRPKTQPENARFGKHLANHLVNWFTFLLDPDLEAANWPAEQAVRQAVVNRKVWGGNRTPAGARAQQILTSVLETCRRQTHNAIAYLASFLRGQQMILIPNTS